MLKNGFYNILGIAIRVILTSITIPIFINLLGIKEYGLWVLISSVLDFSRLAHGGFSTATTYFLSKDLARDNDVSISQTLSITGVTMFALASTIGLILVIFSSSIVNLFPKLNSHNISVAQSAIQFGGIIIWSRLIQEIPIAIGQSYEKYGLINILNFAQVTINNLGMISILLIGGKTLALFKWQAVISLLTMVLNFIIFFSLLKNIRLKFRWDRSKARQIVRYSLAVWLTAIGGTLFQRGDRLIVGSILGTEILGVYSAITSVTTQIHTFSSVAMQPIIPRIGGLLGESNRARLVRQIHKAFIANCVIVAVIGGLLLISSDLITGFLFSNANSGEYAFLFRITTLIYSCFALSAVGHYTLQGIGRSSELFAIVLTSSIVSIALIYFGALYGNLYGAILGNIGYVGILFSNIRVNNLLSEEIS